MKKIFFIISLFVFLSCNLLYYSPDSRLTGKWEYEYDYPNDYRYTSKTYEFKSGNNMCHYSWYNNPYYTIVSGSLVEDNDYIWKESGNKLMFQECNSYGGSYDLNQWKTVSFEYHDSYLLIDGEKYYK